MDDTLWYVGIIISFLGSLSGAAGDTMVRRSYVKAGANAQPSKMIRRPMFCIGMILTTAVDAGCTISALIFAPSSIVTPFAAVHIFWAVVIAHFWLREKVGAWEVLGSAGIVTGVILMVVYAGKEADIRGIGSFSKYASDRGALSYIGVSTVLVSLLVCLSFGIVPFNMGEYSLPVRRLSTALTSGIFGGNTNVAAKFFTIAIAQLLAGDVSVFSRWEFYIVTFATVSLAILQLIFLNAALRRYEAVYVIPTTNSCLVAEGTCGAIWVLHEYPRDPQAFLGGLALTVAGILILTIMHEFPQNKSVMEEPLSMGGVQSPERQQSQQSWFNDSISASFSRTANTITDFSLVMSPSAIYSARTLQERFPPPACRSRSFVEVAPGAQCNSGGDVETGRMSCSPGNRNDTYTRQDTNKVQQQHQTAAHKKVVEEVNTLPLSHGGVSGWEVQDPGALELGDIASSNAPSIPSAAVPVGASTSPQDGGSTIEAKVMQQTPSKRQTPNYLVPPSGRLGGYVRYADAPEASSSAAASPRAMRVVHSDIPHHATHGLEPLGGEAVDSTLRPKGAGMVLSNVPATRNRRDAPYEAGMVIPTTNSVVAATNTVSSKPVPDATADDAPAPVSSPPLLVVSKPPQHTLIRKSYCGQPVTRKLQQNELSDDSGDKKFQHGRFTRKPVVGLLSAFSTVGVPITYAKQSKTPDGSAASATLPSGVLEPTKCASCSCPVSPRGNERVLLQPFEKENHDCGWKPAKHRRHHLSGFVSALKQVATLNGVLTDAPGDTTVIPTAVDLDVRTNREQERTKEEIDERWNSTTVEKGTTVGAPASVSAETAIHAEEGEPECAM